MEDRGGKPARPRAALRSRAPGIRRISGTDVLAPDFRCPACVLNFEKFHLVPPSVGTPCGVRATSRQHVLHSQLHLRPPWDARRRLSGWHLRLRSCGCWLARHKTVRGRGDSPISPGDDHPTRFLSPCRRGDDRFEIHSCVEYLGVGHESGLLNRQIGCKERWKLRGVEKSEPITGPTSRNPNSYGYIITNLRCSIGMRGPSASRHQRGRSDEEARPGPDPKPY